MKIRGRKSFTSMDQSISFSSSSSPSSSASSSSSIATAAHSPLLASSQDSSNSSFESMTNRHRCHGLDLLVKAIHQVTAGSVIGVPYVQKRVTIRRRRRSDCVFFELFERKESEKNLRKKKKKKGKKSFVAKKRVKRVIGLPSKYRDSIVQPWGRRSEIKV